MDAGYVGGAVLSRLIEHSKAVSFELTTLVRSAEKAKILQDKFGVKAVVGTFQDLDKISDLAKNAHVVFHLVRGFVYAIYSITLIVCTIRETPTTWRSFRPS